MGVRLLEGEAMSRGLRKNEFCPIHRSRACCGREAKNAIPRKHKRTGPVTKIPDEFNPRGYREEITPAEKRRRKLILIRKQNGICALCPKPFEDIRDVEVDHKEPQPAGCKKDDHMDNLQAAHRWCNQEKGSKRLQ